jgi:hypothetical protein
VELANKQKSITRDFPQVNVLETKVFCHFLLPPLCLVVLYSSQCAVFYFVASLPKRQLNASRYKEGDLNPPHASFFKVFFATYFLVFISFYCRECAVERAERGGEMKNFFSTFVIRNIGQTQLLFSLL